jgi:hypothetical protein
LEKSGGKNGSRRKKTKNPKIKIIDKIREEVVTLLKVGIVVSFQSSASEQPNVARITLEPKNVPQIARKYNSRLITRNVKAKNISGNWVINAHPSATAISPNPSNRNHEN